MSVKLTPEAFRGWEDFAYHHRVTVVALIESTGRQLVADPGLWDHPLVSEMVVEDARRITEERRSRRRS